MRKRWFLVGVMLLSAFLLVVGCGIPQEAYDAVVAERDAAQAQVASLQDELAKARSQIGTLESDLVNAEGEIETLKGELAEAEVDLDDLKQQITGVRSAWSSLKPKVEISRLFNENQLDWTKYSLGEITEDEANSQATDQWVQIAVALNEIGDEEFSENTKTAWFEEEGSTKLESIVKSFSSLINMIDQDMKNLSKKLAP